MQRLQDRVRAGYHHWIGGEITSDRWPGLALKLNGLYSVDRSIKERARAKKNGNASAMLVAHIDDDNVVRWVLQVSDGHHPAHIMETLDNVLQRDGRIVIQAWGYELVQLDSKWTWRMTKEHQAEWRTRIRHAATHRNPSEASQRARQIVWSLSRVPGFHGIRVSVFRLRGLLLKEWRRLRTHEDMKLLPPKPWPKISYCRRVKSA